MTAKVGWLAAALVCGAVSVVDVKAQTQGAEAQRKRTVATRVATIPVVDGALDEAIWQEATIVTDFVQTEPVEGQPASERTEVRILYDDQAIYIGVICFDSEPSRIITTDSRRDSGLGDMDSFQMILDTYHDQQNGFVFGTNAVGTQYDAQIRNEGQSGGGGGAPTLGRTSGGSGGGVNVNWDGSWDVKALITDTGWTAEFVIPLRTLRYGPPPQVWGLNFTRNIQRKRETVYWSPVSRIYNLTRLSSAGELRELSVATPRNLKIMPYALGSANRSFSAASDTSYGNDFGVDAKFGVTTSLNLDLTYNTDFAQVEVDEQQINLTRFNVLFPEKRPFFLENRGLFAVGKNGEVDLFFSRAIGIDESGELVPIKGGGRLTGKASGINIGLLNMQTDSLLTGETLVTAPNNFSAVRISKDLRNRTTVGGIFVNRSATGDLAGDGNWNRTWGLDGRLGIGEEITFQGFAARTETPGALQSEHAFSGGGEYRTRLFRTDFNYTEVAEDFNPEVGFLERSTEYRQVSTGYHYNLRTQGLTGLGFRELRPHATYESFWDFDGFQETGTVHMDVHMDWENGNFFSPAVNRQYEGLVEPFEVYPGVVVPPGQYAGFHTAFAGNTDRRKAFSFSGNWNYGEFLSGNQNVIVPALTYRIGGTFSTSLRWQRSDIDLPQGAFVTNLGTFRATYNFNTLVNVQGLVQYNDRTDRWSTNIRFNWQQTAATGLYVVYNDTETLNGLGPVNRAFIVKYSHMFDVLQ